MPSLTQLTALLLLLTFCGLVLLGLHVLERARRRKLQASRDEDEQLGNSFADCFRDDQFPNVFTVVAKHHSFERGALRSLSVIVAQTRDELAAWLNNEYRAFDDLEIMIFQPAFVPNEYSDLVSPKLHERLKGFRDRGKFNRAGYIVHVNDHIEYLDQSSIS